MTYRDNHIYYCACISHYHAHNSYLPVIGVHETMHLMHPNYWQITILLVVDLCSSLAYFMMTQPLPIASKLPIKTLVARQLPTTIDVDPLVNLLDSTLIWHALALLHAACNRY